MSDAIKIFEYTDSGSPFFTNFGVFRQFLAIFGNFLNFHL